ncbi:MAG: U32 family peptidase [Bacillota bacterium]|nr:U32 family peptidase [Bacillota bacterium]HHU62410.1 U32 family peptidase [Natronincola sp.]
MELLAPAGSFEAMKAAVENGADAVYLGGRAYSARASATNFSSEEMQETVDFCHIRGVKTYIAVNTLMRDDELDNALRYCADLYNWGVDGVIVQDLGLAHRLRLDVPQLEVHASTQMTIHNSLDFSALEKLGITRVVLARELSLEAIKKIKRQTSLELEVFVHGALCICYSGQCLMSSLIGGRSGNRGQCAQPCRQSYFTSDLAPGEYVLSPKDLSLIEYVNQLREAGVASLKIEGRLKSPDYVGVVVRNYRAALDGQRYKAEELRTVFNRGFTTAYFNNEKPQDLITYHPPLKEQRTGSAIETYSSEKAFKKIKARLTATLQLGEELELNLIDEDGFSAEANSDIRAVKARGTGLTVELLSEKILRLGNDPLEIVELQTKLGDALHLPVSELNETRRKLVESWKTARLAPYTKRQRITFSKQQKVKTIKSQQTTPKIAVTVSSAETAQAVLKAGAELIYFSGRVYKRNPQDWLNELTDVCLLGRESNVPVFAHLERITEDSTLHDIHRSLSKHEFDGVLVGNLGSWELVRKIAGDKPIHTDWSFNAFNSATADYLLSQGASCVTASLELQLSQIRNLADNADVPLSIMVHGPLESMVTKHCTFRDQGCKYQCQTQSPIKLTDKKGYEFPVYFDRWCHMHIFNSRELSLITHINQLKVSGVEYFRIEGRLKDAQSLSNLVDLYRRGLQGENAELQGKEFTKGHYFRGVL